MVGNKVNFQTQTLEALCGALYTTAFIAGKVMSAATVCNFVFYSNHAVMHGVMVNNDLTVAAD